MNAIAPTVPDDARDRADIRTDNRFRWLVPIYGTLVTACIAMLIAVPVSFGIAMFLTEIAPKWLRTPIGAAIELLAGIPSIIYGMWGLFVLVPFLAEHVYPWMDENMGQLPVIGALFSGPPLGLGMGTAGLVLAIMVIPFISSVMREVFLTVPGRLKESAYALGSTRWEVVWHIVLPYTRSAVIGGIFLGLGRALGETMAVTFVLGNAHFLTTSLLEPGNSIAATIANEFTEADSPLYLSSLIALGFLLFVVTFIVLRIAKFMLMGLKRREGNRWPPLANGSIFVAASSMSSRWFFPAPRPCSACSGWSGSCGPRSPRALMRSACTCLPR